MTEHIPEEAGTAPGPVEAQDLEPFEHAPRPSDRPVEHSGAHLAFEATPRVPVPPVPTLAEARVLNAAASVAPVEPPSTSPAFEAVPAAVVVSRPGPSTATIDKPPEVAEPTWIAGSGGRGWNLRNRDDEDERPRQAVAGEPGWSPRESPSSSLDRSSWMVPPAPRRRRVTGRLVAGTFLSLVLAATLAFAGVEWATSSAHAHTITTPHSVGTLAPVSTPATAAVSQQMQKVMQVYGATRVVTGVYGSAGHPTLVVLLAQGPDIHATSNEFFNDFSTGLQGEGVTVDRHATVSTVAGGSSFVCSPATRPAPLTAVSLCGWDDGDTIGLVMDVSGQALATTLQEAEAARTAGEH